MGKDSKIEWTDHSFNPWVGCTHKLLEDGSDHPACEHCYAEAFTKFTGFAKWGPEGTRVKTSEKYWRQPLAWNAQAAKEGTRPRVFCASYADVFEEWPGPLHSHDGLALTDDDMRLEGFAGHPLEMCREDLFTEIIDKTPHLDWLLLTKRPENIRRMWPTTAVGEHEATYRNIMHRPNVWLGTSISDQATADAMIPALRECRDLAPVLFLSIEPLLGPIDLAPSMPPSIGVGVCDVCERRNVPLRDASCPPSVSGMCACYECMPQSIDWVIVGGESGHHARPMHPDWALSIRDQCQAAGVPFFFKQWGEWVPQHNEAMQTIPILPLMDAGKHGIFDESGEWRVNEGQWSRYDNLLGQQMYRIGKKAAGRLIDGREWSEYPRCEVLA